MGITHSKTSGSVPPKIDGDDWDAAHVVTGNNFSATAAPTVNDDSGDGYAVGSMWIDTTADTVYVCVDASVGAAVWNGPFEPAAEGTGPASLSGGTETSSGGYDYYAFTSDGTLTVSAPGMVEVVVVGGGGGGGGYYSGGGGGGGGVIHNAGYYVDSNVTVTVGAGGSAGTSTAGTAATGGNGGYSTFGKLSAVGGGGGGGGATTLSTPPAPGTDGASGGGGGTRQTSAGGVTDSGQGNTGGTARTGNTAGTGAGGGGGGSGAVGTDAGSVDTGGAGGAGIEVAAFAGFGATGYFGGGGGGGGVSAGGAGGSGGGGGGGGTSANTGMTAGTANTGGGGGGGGNTSTSGSVGGAGGSGVVVVRTSALLAKYGRFAWELDQAPASPNALDDEFNDAASLAADWTAFGRAASTAEINATGKEGLLHLYLANNTGGAELCGYQKTMPTSYPYYITTSVVESTYTTNYCRGGGIVLLDSGITDALYVGLVWNGGKTLQVIVYAGLSGYSGQAYLVAMSQMPLRFRIKVNSATSFDLEVPEAPASVLGVAAWRAVLSGSNPGFDIAKAGPGMSTEGNASLHAVWDYFRVS